MKYLSTAADNSATVRRSPPPGFGRLIILTAAVLLVGCAHREPPTLIPVATSCVTGDLPAEPPKVSGELTGDAGRDAGIIAGSALELRAWGRALYNMLLACRSH